jgi:predicted nucleic acid-binding protein
MKAVVVDASVIMAAFFPEPFHEESVALLDSGVRLFAPDLIYAEVGNVIWKRHGRGDIDNKDAADIFNDVMSLPLEITASKQLADQALTLAMQTGRTVYDCLYVALAVQTKTIMFSNDRRLVNSLSAGPLKKYISALGPIH